MLDHSNPPAMHFLLIEGRPRLPIEFRRFQLLFLVVNLSAAIPANCQAREPNGVEKKRG
jgi:hypothetical protein